MPDLQRLVQWATWTGQHATALFVTALVLALASTCACWWGVRRYSGPEFRFAGTPSRFWSLRIAIGATVTLLGIFVFAGLAGELGTQEELSQLDPSFTNALRSNVPTLVVSVFAALTHLGDTVTLTFLCVVVTVALAAFHQLGLALGWVVLVAGNGLLNLTLKHAFARIRPLGLDGLTLEEGFSFPSGHSSGSVVAYGMLAYLALRLLPFRWHLPVLLVAITLAFAVGSSRLFLRVHFASDVIAGFASGAAWLALGVTALELTRTRLQRRRA